MPEFKQFLSSSELLEQRSRYAELIDVSRYFAHKFLSSLPADPMMISIANGDNYLLEMMGNASMISVTRQLGITEGVCFTEEMGINSQLLCLTSGNPVQLIGEDHFHTALHHSACYTVPLYDGPGSEHPYAAITLMTQASSAHPQLLALLCTMADSIERELRLRKQHIQQQILTQALLETSHYGVIITDETGRILSMNDSAAGMLQLASASAQINASSFDLPLAGDCFRQVVERHLLRSWVWSCRIGPATHSATSSWTSSPSTMKAGS